MHSEDVDYCEEVSPTGDKTGRLVEINSAHQTAIPHKISAVLVFTGDGKLIVQAHKKYGRRYDHSVGGHVDPGEDYEEAAKREMQEELGLLIPMTYVARDVYGYVEYPEWNMKSVHLYGVYVATAPVGWKFTPNDEVDKIKVMSLENVVMKMNAYPEKFLHGFIVTLGTYLKHIDSHLQINSLQ
jgi:isopentenyl-diphosphate Delta-isomerase